MGETEPQPIQVCVYPKKVNFSFLPCEKNNFQIGGEIWNIPRSKKFKASNDLSNFVISCIDNSKKIYAFWSEESYKAKSTYRSFLGVKIVKDVERSKKENRENEAARVLSFDPDSMKNLTIDDMKRLKQQKELNIFSEEEIIDGDEVIIVGDNEELSDEEIDDILFRD